MWWINIEINIARKGSMNAKRIENENSKKSKISKEKNKFELE